MGLCLQVVWLHPLHFQHPQRHEKQESAKKALLHLPKELGPCFYTLSGGGLKSRPSVLLLSRVQPCGRSQSGVVCILVKESHVTKNMFFLTQIQGTLSFHVFRAPCDLGKKSLSAPQRGVVCSPSTATLLVEPRDISPSLLKGDCPLASALRSDFNRLNWVVHQSQNCTCI